MSSQKKIAIVYDWIDSWGGVERILLTFHETFPDADFFTSYVDLEKAKWAKDLKIKTSFIQNLPNFIKKSRKLSFFLYPYAFESFNFNKYDIVISVTSSFAKAVVTKPETLHVCYLLTPTRYLWLYPRQYLAGWQRILGKTYFNNIKNWDYIISQRPDKMIAISQTVADRCKLYYRRKAEIIYPPFNIGYWNDIKSKVKSQSFDVAQDDPERSRMGQKSKFQVKNKKFYLVVSRLEPYKRVDLVVKVFSQTGKDIVVVGRGTQLNKLIRQAKPNIKFISDITDQELALLYSQAEGLIMPQEEDFGYVSLEAQFFGCPVIAYGKGGTTETIIPNKTGIFFMAQDAMSLKQALEKYDKIKQVLKQNLKEMGIKGFDKYALDNFKNNFINQLTPISSNY